jgi:hypothetical protein
MDEGDQECEGGLTDRAMWRRMPSLSATVETQHVETWRATGTSFGMLRVQRDTVLYPERSTAMRAFSLVLVIVQIVAVVSANGYSPINGCQITLDSYRFDLCPLLSRRNNSGHVDLVLHHQTPPTITTIVYNISLNGPLRKSDSIFDDEQVSLVVMYCCASNLIIFVIQCISGTWACLTSKLLSTLIRPVPALTELI